jgi:mono/diheme cytochrome c family protein
MNEHSHGALRWLACVGLAALAGAHAPAYAQNSTAAGSSPSRLTLDTGRQIYQAGCISCHGPDGKGQSQELAGFERPETFPDFSDCPTSTPEPDVQWRAIITNGGPARGFSQIMPAFKDLLTSTQISKVIEYLRGFCAERAWPPGDLNLPRPMVTEKAFPENETVVTGAFGGGSGVATSAVYERRIGASAMMEVAVPYEFPHDDGRWSAAFGDLAIGYKQKLLHSLAKGSIFSVGGEMSVPTGDPVLGTGGQSTIFEGFVAFGQILPADSFVQIHTGFELPVHPDLVPRAYYFRTALGKTFAQERGIGRRWTPMVEFIADRDLTDGAVTNWDVIPEIQIPVSKRMHILGSVGVRVPINNTSDRPTQMMFYVLWDWADGGLKEGW